MTQKTSFKSRLKQALSFFLSDLKSCNTFLIVFAIISAVVITVCLTICLVLGNDSTFSMMLSSLSFAGITNSGIGEMELFQYTSASLIYLISIVFTIIYTVRIYSYLHNKRKADLYGSLPIGRATLFITKSASAYLMSIIPAIFFLSVISIISVCSGHSVVTDLTKLFPEMCMGTLASIAFFGLIAVCCGTMLNSVLMFVAVCIAYPLSAIFIKGIIVGCFDGFFVGIFKDSIIMNALNPLAAYDGINVIYWLIFSAVCLVLAAFLARKRKAERAQSAFAFHLPCYIIKVLVSFLAGMFLGVLFGSVNVLGGFGGFVFGFILASVPVYIIIHLILYRGFSKLVKTAIPLGALIVVSCVGVALCCFDSFGYNSYVPKVKDIKSAGFFEEGSNFQNLDKVTNSSLRNMADDVTDKETITFITNSHSNLINKRNYSIQNKFKNTWVSMFTDNFLFFSKELSQPYCGYAYKLNDGRIITRAYNRFNAFYDTDAIYDDDNTDIINSKGYIKTYSPIAKAEYADLSEFAVFGFNRKDTEKKHADLVVNRIASGYYGDDSQSVAPTGSSEAYKRIKDAFLEDIDNCNDEEFKKVVGYSDTFYGSGDPDYSDYSTLVESVPDVVCVIQLSTGSPYNAFSSTSVSPYERLSNSDTAYTTASYVIPRSFTKTIEVLQDLGMLDKNMYVKENGDYNGTSTITYDDYYDDYYDDDSDYSYSVSDIDDSIY